MTPKISDAEEKVMAVLWRESPLTAQQVIAALESSAWSDRTVKTLLSRLLKKGAIRFQQQGRHYLYFPQLDYSSYRRQQSRRLVERFFDGRLTPLVAGFAQRGELEEDDVRALRALLAKLESENG